MPFAAIVNYDDPYVRPLILAALSRLPTNSFTIYPDLTSIPADVPILQFSDYELLDFSHALAHPSSLISSYVIRKALIRKHYLSNTVSSWITKHPQSMLKEHVKPSVEFEVDYAEFLDDALVEAYELKESWARGEGKEPEEREWWILKPGMSERGMGIRLFSSEEELTAIFEEWDVESDDEDGDEAEGSQAEEADVDKPAVSSASSTGIITSQLRHFVAQPYIHPPLLLHPSDAADGQPRKFHIRTYVLCAGTLRVYVYRPMLALFAAQPYSAPGSTSTSTDAADLRAHLTNTCLQNSDVRDGSVAAFWDLRDDDCPLPAGWKKDVFSQICAVTGEVFEAAARGQMVHFQPLPNAFEMYGLDFLVDERGVAWLLEVNAYPDFKQTGVALEGLVKGFFEEVVDTVVGPWFEVGVAEAKKADEERLVKVLDLDLGRR